MNHYRRLIPALALLGGALAFQSIETQIGKKRSEAPAQFEIGRKAYNPPSGGNSLMQPVEPEPEPPADPRITGAVRMSDDTRSNDFPDIVSNPRDRNEAWCAWVSYSGRQDQIRISKWIAAQKIWGTWSMVPGVTGDVWRPRLAYDGKGRVWILWSQQDRQNFDLYARWYDGSTYGPLERITTAPQGDFDARAATDSKGRIWIAWQGFRNGQSDIFLSHYDGSKWAPELRVSDSPRNDWAPAIAVDSKDTVYVAWDTYDRGQYDVRMRSWANGKLSPVVPVADTPRYEAQASLAVDRRDRVWVAYEAGPVGWGKDTGRTIPAGQTPGAMLMDERRIEVVAYSGDLRQGMAPEISAKLPRHKEKPPVTSPEPVFGAPQLVVDDSGRLHLLLRNQLGKQFATFWWEYIATLGASGWSDPAPLPYSNGRNSMSAAAAPGPEGSVWLTWPRDNDPRNSIFRTMPEETFIENVYTARYVPAGPASEPQLEARQPAVVSKPAGHADEDKRVAAMRAYRANAAGKPWRIVRGDLHRHTEMSADLRGVPDGSILDFYRYMMDAASMDFGIISDHMNGSDREYWWWLEEKLADLFYAPPSYTPLYGYERSVNYPNGHRNVIHTRRGITPVPFFQPPEYPIKSHNGAAFVIEGDTKMLYGEIRRTGGISIPHTSATTMGTDWRDNDRELEPLVEIFQGDRYNYECAACPLADPGGAKGSEGESVLEQPRPAGFVHNAWEKGYRLGVIASSDHWSTHMSYALVYTPDLSRESIHNAMRRRRTYAATDNIILEYRMGEHFMGDEFAAAQIPPISVKIAGTAPIADLAIVRNNRVVYHTAPGTSTANVQYQDTAPSKGLNWYYVRAQQKDRQMVWSSPIWVTVK